MISISTIHPDAELRDALTGEIQVKNASGDMQAVTVYEDHEKSSNETPDDFIIVYINGSVKGLGSDIDFAKGNLRIDIYCKLNNDGSIKRNRIDRILNQLDYKVDKKNTEHFYFEYDMPRFITPTTPNVSSGYSVTILNMRWTTNSKFNKPVTP